MNPEPRIPNPEPRPLLHRPLSAEIAAVTAVGYVRGAELWHLACGLYVAESPEELTFLTLDEWQRAVAKALGFKT